MRARRAAAAGLLLAALSVPAARPAGAQEPDWLPSSKEYFWPLLADPTEPHYGVRLTMPAKRRRVGEIALGDTLGVYRFHSGATDVQLNLGGGVIGRFDVSKLTNDFQAADFTFALPVDVHRGRHDLRLMYWHVSSHLGDDFIAHESPVLRKALTDELRWLYSFGPGRLRFYGGHAWAFSVSPHGSRRNRFHGGAEWSGRPFLNGRAHALLAGHLERLERAGPGLDLTLRAGVRVADEQRVGALTYFVEFFNGHLPYQQFTSRRETHGALGLRFEMGNPIREPA